MEYYESLVDLVGKTPLVRLSHVTKGLKPLVLAKVEYFNPGGPAKERIALGILDAGERAGAL